MKKHKDSLLAIVKALARKQLQGHSPGELIAREQNYKGYAKEIMVIHLRARRFLRSRGK